MEGFEVRAGVEAAGVVTDLLIKDEYGNEIELECDGAQDSVKTGMPDTKKQTILERAGYQVERVSVREWYHSSAACIERIKQIFNN